MDSPQRNQKDSQIQKISRRLRSARLLKVGIKSGLKAAGSAVHVAMGRKTKQDSYEEFMAQAMSYFVREASQLKGGVMKAGQLLSVYGEHFFPPEVNKILKSLQSDSRVVVFDEMWKKIRSSLGVERASCFEMDHVPIGAASLGQVYAAKLHKPSETCMVAIKVQYPRVGSAIESDLATVKKLITMMKILPGSGQYDMVYQEVKTMLSREMDYSRELKYMQKYQDLLANDPILRVPKVYTDFSTKTILTMEHVRGRRLDDPVVTALSQQRRNRFALAIMRLMLAEIFEWRMVQTDPHIGNFLVQLTEDGFAEDALYLLDFGAVRRFRLDYIENFRGLTWSALKQYREDIVTYGRKLGFLRLSDSQEMNDLFIDIALKAVEPFSQEYAGRCDVSGEYGDHEYDWSHLGFIHEISDLARYAVFQFKLRAPPPEAIFMDRKLVGTVTLIKVLRAKLGAQKMLTVAVKPKSG